MNFDDWKAWSWHTLTGIFLFQPQLITLIYWSLKLFFQMIWYTDVLLQKKSIPKLWSVWWNLSIIFLIFQCRYVQFGPSMIVRESPQEAKLCQGWFSLTVIKVENILKGSLGLILSLSSSVKIQIMGGKDCLRCKGKTLSTNFQNQKSLLTSPIDFMLYYFK